MLILFLYTHVIVLDHDFPMLDNLCQSYYIKIACRITFTGYYFMFLQ